MTISPTAANRPVGHMCFSEKKELRKKTKSLVDFFIGYNYDTPSMNFIDGALEISWSIPL